MYGLTLLAALLLPVGGDAIGSDPAATSDNGGLSAHYGTPGIALHVTQPTTLEQLGLVAFGPVTEAQYSLRIWELKTWINGGDAITEVWTDQPEWASWGNAGLAGAYESTYLGTLPVRLTLDAGQWLVGVHATEPVRISGSTLLADASRLDRIATYETAEGVRGAVPDGMDWGMTLLASAVPEPATWWLAVALCVIRRRACRLN